MSNSYTIRPEPPGPAFRDQILKMVLDRRDASQKYSYVYRRKLPEFYDLWRGFYSGNFTPTKNNLHIPLIFSAVQSDVARKVATAFAQWPVVGFQGFGPDDEPHSRKQEALVNAQLRDANAIEKEIVTFLSADLYGTAVSQVMWQHESEIRTVHDFQAMPLSEEVIRQIQRKRVTTFDGPNYRNIDLLDFFPQPGYRFINGNDGMQWCLVRYYLDVDQLRFMASDQGGNVFDAAEVARLTRESGAQNVRLDEALLRRFETRHGVAPHKNVSDRFSRPVEILEMWGKIPLELSGPFGSTNVVISLANEKFLLRARENPLSHQQKPFISYSPTPDPHYFHAPGKAEVAYQLQIAGNRFVNHQLDAADLLVHPMWIYNRQKGPNTRNLVAGPGKIFGVEGSPSDALAPVQLDMRTLQAGAATTQAMWEYVQMGTGVQEDTVMGGQGADRQTAREFLGRREASGTRLMLESVIYDQTYLEPLADMFSAMNLQFLQLPREVLILGEAARTDPITGEPLKQSREQITGESLARQYSARAIGTTMALSRETQKANDLQMFQILAGANDMLAGSFNLVNFLRQMLTNLGYHNVNELIQKAPSVAENLGQNGMDSAANMPGDVGQLLQMAGGAGASGPTSGTPGI